ncbi:MAG: ImmA/IrrE family metallo-endopeptidase [Bacteroidales bacterium]|nr:ImmA/IrrE family metallo-endopeptidase [Bacteroidales bacterium]
MPQLNIPGIPDEDEDAEKSLLANLLQESRLYHQSKDYKELLDFVTKLPNFAPFNAFLLNLQKPGLRFAASKFDWHQRFGREVKEGARPLVILWPFSPIALVYDVDDTEGYPLPDSVLHAFQATGVLKNNDILHFQNLLLRQGIELRQIKYGDGHAGHIQAEQIIEGTDIIERSTDTKKRPTYRIRVNSTHDPNVQFVTLIHEMAHLYLGHLGPDKYLKIGERFSMTHEQAELEAESVAYLVCKRYGVESKSEAYLADYVKANDKTGDIHFYMIMKAAGQIENVLNLGDMVSFGPKKQLR